MAALTPKQRYRVSEKGRAENRERMRRRRQRLRACGSRAGNLLRRQVDWLGWAPCRMCLRVHVSSLIEVDHRKPLVRGGCDSPDNVWTLCVPCHRTKTAIEATWR